MAADDEEGGERRGATGLEPHNPGRALTGRCGRAICCPWVLGARESRDPMHVFLREHSVFF